MITKKGPLVCEILIKAVTKAKINPRINEIDANGNYVVSEAEQLGKSSNSHGCVRLSVADAKWFYENIKTGTKVVVES